MEDKNPKLESKGAYRLCPGTESPKKKESLFRRYRRLKREIKDKKSQIETFTTFRNSFTARRDYLYELQLKEEVNSKIDIPKLLKDEIDGKEFSDKTIRMLKKELSDKQTEFNTTCKRPILRLAALLLAVSITAYTTNHFINKKPQQDFEKLWAEKVPESNSNDPNVVIQKAIDLLHDNFVKENRLNIDSSQIRTFVDTREYEANAFHPNSGSITEYSIGKAKRNERGENIDDSSGRPVYKYEFYRYTVETKNYSDGRVDTIHSGKIPPKYKDALDLIAKAQRILETNGNDKSAALSAAQEAFKYVATMEITSFRTDTDPEDIKHIQDNGSLPNDLTYRFDEDGYLVDHDIDDGR